MADAFLDNLTVVELGDRLAAGLCSGLLQRLGARVLVVEPAGADATPAADSKHRHRALLCAGKEALQVDFADKRDVDALVAIINGADAVIISSDRDRAYGEPLVSAIAAAPVVCDLTAFGDSAQSADEAYTDAMMQAFAGLMHTTGSPDGPPTTSQVPITECSTAVFGAAGLLCALRARTPATQRVDVAMFDAAVSMLSTFLPAHFAGLSPQRIGNRHPSMSPWNAYPARDGWVLLCSASNDMWKRVCRVIGRDELAQDARFATMPDRVKHADEADAVMLPWVREHRVNECVEIFTAAGVPCGPVYTVPEMLGDSNLAARGAFVHLKDPVTQKEVTVPGRLIKGSRADTSVPAEIPRGERVTDAVSRARVRKSREHVADAVESSDDGVLAGVRVVEMGSYTTAPLAARNLGALGAYVVKLEPPAGELSRASPPHVDGQSYFCTLSNSDKRCVAADLQTDEGKALFVRLLAQADVFVENMKPGALERFGFSPAQIEAINPRLVYCSVSGFGAGSPLAARPAMDSTIQGMAGIMDLTRQDGVPCKVGISIADILGGQFALLAVLAGLAYRARTGKGQFIDLAMLDVSAWLTQFAWNPGVDRHNEGRIVQCRDGHACVVDASAPAGSASPMHDDESVAAMTRADAVGHYAARGLRCVAVNSVSEVAMHVRTGARELIVPRPSRDGKTWPLLACPIRLHPRAPQVRRAIGEVGADLAEVLRDWNIECVTFTAPA